MLAGGAAALAGRRRLAARSGDAGASAGTTGRSSSTRSAGSAILMRPRSSCASSDRAWAEMVATGVTVLRDTVLPVGNVADPWGDYQKDIALKQNILAANPDRLMLVRSAADILKAKREKKFGGRPRHPGHVDGRARARPAGAAEEGRGDDRPADLQQPQPVGRRRARAGQRRPVEARARRRSSGSRRRNCCSTSATAARGRWPRRRPSPSGRWSSATPAPGR